MIVIDGLDHCLEYVARLGYTAKPDFPGWIVQAEEIMCDTADLLLYASQQDTWYHKIFKPFKVHYYRKSKIFSVVDRNGTYHIVDPHKRTVNNIKIPKAMLESKQYIFVSDNW